MTQPLDPWTLQQAAARWPDETLNKRAAQSFLRSLELEAALAQDELRQQQPATAPDPLRAELRDLLEHVGTRPGQAQQIHADTIRALLAQYPDEEPDEDPDPLADLIDHLQQRRRETLRVLRQCTDANADYWRWQGHAELARQLLTRLGAEVPQ